jgi:diguanylate cyclase (GGDEF)-like protein/PAS domain S-box-containing protein
MTTFNHDICRYLSNIASGRLPDENLTGFFCSKELLDVTNRFSSMSADIERLKTCNLVLVDQNQRIRDDERLYRSIFENAVVGIMILSEDGKVIHVNRAMEYMLGYQAEDLKLMNLSEVTMPEDYSIDAELQQSLIEGRSTYYQVEKRYVRNDGILFWGMVTVSIEWDEAGTPFLINMVEDISARKSVELQLKQASTHDALTGLYNRAYFDSEFTSLQHNMRLPVSIIVVDVDGLKLTNDSKGHEAGDRLIVSVATILTEACRGDDTIARVGGDEFSILLPATDEENLQVVLDRINKSQDRFNNANSNFKVEFSKGSATALKGKDISNALRLADERMYADKMMRKSVALRQAQGERT